MVVHIDSSYIEKTIPESNIFTNLKTIHYDYYCTRNYYNYFRYYISNSILKYYLLKLFLGNIAKKSSTKFEKENY